MNKIEKSAVCLLVLFVCFLSACHNKAGKEGAGNTRILTDMAGRKVEIPQNIRSVFIDRHSVQMFYAFDTAMTVNRVFNYNESEKKFLKKSFYENKPYVIEGASEEIVRLKPDVVIYSQELTKTNIETVNALQAKINIPVILLDMDINKYKETLAFMGKVLHQPEKANELIGFIKTYIDSIPAKARTIPEKEKKRIYYAEGMKGLKTDPSGSVHSLLIDLVGAKNVATVDLLPGKGMTNVSMEQIYVWNPDIVLVWSGNFDGLDSYKFIKSSPVWAQLKAVKQNLLYQVPWRPFGWIDRPPGINRLIGYIWLSHLLYPDVYKVDMLAVTKEFFRKFYHYDMSDAEALSIINPQPLLN
ncbi:ABC transporter substrate-binding protein [uncultured Bacteroides sp.]|uniref:ABC transporter substrate-binding protein n=1 Tax=uncultured Bacteroides sp. TaxID=162156 RepID=UPI002AA8B825|nr:ABC transporter substrate-binding protein [uncultured Bacteroides sp.]